MEGKLIIFSAPSGAGKTTIVKHLLKTFPNDLAFSISASTRKPRGEEVDGKDYYFMPKEAFLHKIAHKEFVEFEEVYAGTYYGTLRSEIERIWGLGKQVIFDIDVEGGLHLKRKYGEQALAVFVLPPSFDELVRRLKGRGTESEEKVQERIQKAKKELTYSGEFDVCLLNDALDTACLKAEEIIQTFLKA